MAATNSPKPAAPSGAPHRSQATTPSSSSLARLNTCTPSTAGRWITWKNFPNGMNTSDRITTPMWRIARNS